MFGLLDESNVLFLCEFRDLSEQSLRQVNFSVHPLPQFLLRVVVMRRLWRTVIVLNLANLESMKNAKCRG